MTEPTLTWTRVVTKLWPPDSTRRMRIPKGMIAHPLTVGRMRPSVGRPQGQLRDFRATLTPTSAGLHVKEYPSFYEAHLDTAESLYGPFDHLYRRREPRALFVSGSAALGALMGATIGRSRASAIAGAVAAGLVAAVAASVARE